MAVHRIASLAVTACCALASLVTSSPAHAEAGRAPPRCEAFALPRYSTVVPSNIPALVAMPGPAAEGTQRMTLTSFTAVEGAGAGAALADAFVRSSDLRPSGATLFAPNAPLQADTIFEATFAVDCDGIDTTTTARFATKGPVDLPTTIGTLTTRAGDAPQGMEIYVEATPELLAFLPVTMLQLQTRAGYAVIAGYGQAQLADGGRVKVRTPSVFPLDLCAPEDEGHTHIESMSLHAHVAGAETDPPPVSFDVAIACERPKPATTAPTSANDDASNGGGCTTAPSSSHSAWAMLALGAALAVASRVRRSSR